MSITSKQGGKKRSRSKKPDELLGSVVRETATPAALEILRGNERFVFPDGTAWVILVLEAEKIGGLSKRDGRDEAKGSIIELIGDDSIQTLATQDMLEAQVFGIIPTQATLERMDEYSLLRNAEYTWAVVHQQNQGLEVDVVADATFAQAQEVSEGLLTLQSVVGVDEWVKHGGTSAMVTEKTNDETIDAISFDENDSFFDSDVVNSVELYDSEDTSDADIDVPIFDEDDDLVLDDEIFEGVEPDNSKESLRAEDDQDIEEDFVADPSEIRSTLARRFLSEDLDLQVTLDEFITSFNVGAMTVEIDVPEGSSSWLGDQISYLTRQANTQLNKLHIDGETQLQAEYVNLMSLHAEQVIREVSLEREDGIYQELTAGAKAEYREALATKEERGRAAQADIVQAFEETIQQVGEQAALQAQMQYRERNKTRIQREQIDAVAAIEAKIENNYSFIQQEILNLRRKDAARKMAIGKTRIFEVLAEHQQQNLAAERELLVSLTADIQRVIDENRKNDISRIQVLGTEQATFDRVEVLEREHAGILERIRAEHAEQLRQTQEEFEKNRQATIEQLKIRDEEWQHSLNLEKEKTQSQSNRVTDLLDQMAHMGETFKKQYDDRVHDLQADRQAYIQDLERSNQMQSRMNKVLTVMIIALGLLMLTAGFIIGVLVKQ